MLVGPPGVSGGAVPDLVGVGRETEKDYAQVTLILCVKCFVLIMTFCVIERKLNMTLMEVSIFLKVTFRLRFD